MYNNYNGIHILLTYMYLFSVALVGLDIYRVSVPLNAPYVLRSSKYVCNNCISVCACVHVCVCVCTRVCVCVCTRVRVCVCMRACICVVHACATHKYIVILVNLFYEVHYTFTHY